jgi:hypothetical protein
MLYRIILISLLGLKLSCDNQEKHPPNAGTPIARVHNQYLYKQDIENIAPVTTNTKDSLEWVEHYIQNWLTKQLLVSKAEAQEVIQTNDIEKKVHEFRTSLIAHNYIEKLVNERLNKKHLTTEEIQHYYETNQENFKLRHNIVRGKFMVIPKTAPNIVSLKGLIISKKVEDSIALEAYCSEFAKDYSLNESNWLKWDDIVTKTPFSKVPDKTRLLKRASFTEVQDEAYRYYIKIEAYKITNDIAPLELVKNQIIDVLLYKRKLELANQIKEEILQQAKVNNDYTIYEYSK